MCQRDQHRVFEEDRMIQCEQRQDLPLADCTAAPKTPLPSSRRSWHIDFTKVGKLTRDEELVPGTG